TLRSRRVGDGCDLGAVEFNEADLDRLGEVRVPMRWCVLQGTSATEDPASGGPSGVALGRLDGANGVLTAESDTRLLLRSGANSLDPNIPVLSHRGPTGMEGDVYVNLDPASTDVTEFQSLVNECREKWAGLPGGVTAVLIRRFVDENGNELP